jgi:hypothetical protein
MGVLMKEIPLSRGLVALVDDCDYERVMAAGPWFALVARPGHNTTYASRHIYKSDGRRTAQLMHRFILGLTDPKILVDHKDRNGLHNWRGNLRIATNAQNRANSGKYSGSSPYRGVSWHNRIRKWCAVIRKDNKLRHLGYFADETEAAHRYDLAARFHFGEFANCNFPSPAIPEERS